MLLLLFIEKNRKTLKIRGNKTFFEKFSVMSRRKSKNLLSQHPDPTMFTYFTHYVIN